MYSINFNKLTIYFNLIILFLIGFYLINDFFKSKTLVKEKKILEQKSHTNFSETNNNIQKDLSLININLPKLPKRNFSNSIIQADSKLIKTENEETQFSKIKPIKFNKSSLKKNSDLVIEPIKYSQITKKKQIKKYKIEKNNFEDKNKNMEHDINDLVNDGNEFLKNKNKDFKIEFLWPKNVSVHNKIYNILNKCLKSQTVLMREDNKIFGINGFISRDELNKKFSNIIRVPTGVYSDLEKNNITKIKGSYLNGNNGKHLRIFLKNIDAYIIGIFMKLAKNKALEMKDIKGQYKIIDKKLYLDNLIINSIKFREKILLSSLDKSCTI
jgi:hypothetical protein